VRTGFLAQWGFLGWYLRVDIPVYINTEASILYHLNFIGERTEHLSKLEPFVLSND